MFWRVHAHREDAKPAKLKNPELKHRASAGKRCWQRRPRGRLFSYVISTPTQPSDGQGRDEQKDTLHGAGPRNRRRPRCRHEHNGRAGRVAAANDRWWGRWSAHWHVSEGRVSEAPHAELDGKLVVQRRYPTCPATRGMTPRPRNRRFTRISGTKNSTKTSMPRQHDLTQTHGSWQQWSRIWSQLQK